MPSDAVDARPFGMPVHATAVAIGRRGLLIVGPSGSGKSRLACNLIEASTPRRVVRLVGDDRILLTGDAKGCWARAHPRIAGFIERRDLGIVALPYVERVRLAGIVVLAPGAERPAVLAALPCLIRPAAEAGEAAGVAAAEVFAWWRGATTTPRAKPCVASRSGAKD